MAQGGEVYLSMLVKSCRGLFGPTESNQKSKVTNSKNNHWNYIKESVRVQFWVRDRLYWLRIRL